MTEIVPLPVNLPVITERLPAMVANASARLASASGPAEVLEARRMAGTVYDVAKRAQEQAIAQGAAIEVIAAISEAKASCLVIEGEAKAIFARYYNDAQERGEIPKAGRPISRDVGNYENGNLAKDFQHIISDGRRIAKAEAAEPGVVQHAIDEAMKNGIEPTRKLVMDAVRRAIPPAVPKAEEGRRSVSLEEWKTMSAHQRKQALAIIDKGARFLKQTTTGIEWAAWSWNPVTGCLHSCPYCYARDLTERYPNGFPHGFAPALNLDRLGAAHRTKVPEGADRDARLKNVFTCSMADLFGRWVPREWIELVLDEIREAPQWNFLMLTKFPKRMSEFDIPENCWMGTTVDLQARVPAAEAAFDKIGAKVKWLSCEPLLEPLKFKHLDRFNWIVIGGASASSRTPEWRPPRQWITDLEAQADAAGLRVYEKTNLLGKRRLELPFNAPIAGDDNEELPAVFNYLRGRNE